MGGAGCEGTTCSRRERRVGQVVRVLPVAGGRAGWVRLGGSYL